MYPLPTRPALSHLSSRKRRRSVSPQLAPHIPNRPRIDDTYHTTSDVDGDYDSDDDDGISGGNVNDVTFTMADIHAYCEERATSIGSPPSKLNTSTSPSKKRVYTPHDHDKGFEREAQRAAKRAQLPENTVPCTTFNFKAATTGTSHQRSRHLRPVCAPQTQTYWNDTVPRRMVSSDLVDLVYHFPLFIKPRGTEHLTEHLVSFGKTRKLVVGGGADAKKRNCTAAYRQTKGAVAGCCILSRIWHAVGHTHEDSSLSTDFLKSATIYGNSMRLLHDLRFLSIRVNTVLKTIDPPQYEALSKLVARAAEKYPHVKALAVIDPLLMEGRAIQFNRQTPKHADRLDPLLSWAFIVVLGDVKTGTMFIPCLNLRVRYLSGDAIAVRGRLLQHEVEAWEGGQRISIAHFTHTALWNEFGMECP